MSDETKKKISDAIMLEEPIERGDQKIESIKLRKPSSGELRGLTWADLTQMKVDTLIELLPRISMPTITKIEAAAMDPADQLQCVQVVGDFFLTKGMREEANLTP